MTLTVSKIGILHLSRRLWRHLSQRRRRQFVLLMALMFVGALSEALTLGAVVPFLGILTSPDVVFQQPTVARIASALQIETPQQLLLPLTLGFVTAALVAASIRMLLLWISTRLAFVAGHDLSIDVYRRTLHQPYHVHVARNSSEVISGITVKVTAAVVVLYNLLILISSVVFVGAITSALIAINPVVAVASTIGFGSCYGVVTWFARKRLRENSRRIAHEQTQVVKSLQEGLGGIRDVLLDGTQPMYCAAYRDADYPLRLAQGSNNFIGGSPRFVMEGLGMVLIAFVAYVMSARFGGVATALPLLGVLAVGAQRLLPSLQQGFNAWAVVAGNQISLSDTLDLLSQPLPKDALEPPPAPMPFRKSIRLRSVRFRYTSEGPNVVDGVDLTIPKGARVGFVGSTGSGKSTILDLIMGLLTPTEGDLMVDDRVINGDIVRAWQRTIAHVPQHIFLADSTLASNIAFGLPAEEIDLQRVRRVARQAQIAEFIESRPQGYDAMVGERGIRLSGGQRQRIGIARALYKQADVLVFDEATSALDNATEQSVMDAINLLNKDLTILLVAHRLSTVRRCDIIVHLEHGRVVATGTYDELLERSPSFKRLAHVAA